MGANSKCDCQAFLIGHALKHARPFSLLDQPHSQTWTDARASARTHHPPLVCCRRLLALTPRPAPLPLLPPQPTALDRRRHRETDRPNPLHRHGRLHAFRRLRVCWPLCSPTSHTPPAFLLTAGTRLAAHNPISWHHYLRANPRAVTPFSPLLQSFAPAILNLRAGRVPRPLEVPNPLFRDGSPGPQ